ncbi:MAG: hypothetical protein H6970_09920 [Gammaproteobacteria bacterium]|nr:hypothetical protein [Gammaproteobacteria bacterium]
MKPAHPTATVLIGFACFVAIAAGLGTVWAAPSPEDACQSLATLPRQSDTPPSNKTVLTCLPHPVAIDGRLVGGSTRDRWIGVEQWVPADLEAGQCRSLAPESASSGLPYRCYVFDRLLGECEGRAVSACSSASSGDPWFAVDFPECKFPSFNVGIAAPWNALPRLPKVLTNHDDLIPIVRAFLNGKGLQNAPIRIEFAHSVDLDGDGTAEVIVHARSSRDEPDDYAPTDYSLLLLVKDSNWANSAIITAWWPTEQEHEGSYERYESSYADLNGDNKMEIIVRWSGYEEGGLRIYTLRDGVPVETPLGYYEGV